MSPEIDMSELCCQDLNSNNFMKTTSKIFLVGLVFASFACGGGTEETTTTSEAEPIENTETEQTTTVSDDPMQNKGVGPITSITLDEIDATMASEGKTLFDTKCSACHKMDARAVGPALGGVTTRRSSEWIMNMILDPEKMTKEDPIAKALFEEYMTTMANQSLIEDEARKILEYFRDYDKQ